MWSRDRSPAGPDRKPIQAGLSQGLQRQRQGAGGRLARRRKKSRRPPTQSDARNGLSCRETAKNAKTNGRSKGKRSLSPSTSLFVKSFRHQTSAFPKRFWFLVFLNSPLPLLRNALNDHLFFLKKKKRGRHISTSFIGYLPDIRRFQFSFPSAPLAVWVPGPRRGAAKKKIDGPPRAFAKSQTHPPSDFFFLTFFVSTFLGVSRKGEFKNTIQIFWQKVRVEHFFQNFDKIFDVSFSSTTFVLSHFRVFPAMGVQKHYKKMFCKKIVSKSVYKKFDQKSKTDFFSIFFVITIKNIKKTNLTLVLFWPLTHPPTTGVTDFFIGGPLRSKTPEGR
jgi:hypothetical protein